MKIGIYWRIFSFSLKWHCQNLDFWKTVKNQYNKNFETLLNFFFLILGQRHGVLISVKPIRIGLRSGGKSTEIYFFCFICFEGVCYELFTCRSSRMSTYTSALQPVNKGRNKFCLCLLCSQPTVTLIQLNQLTESQPESVVKISF